MKINKEKIFTDQKLFTKCDEKRRIDFIVLHHVGFSVSSAIKCWKNLGLSTHYIIDNKGEIFQLCEDNNISYHAGISNFRGFENLNQNSIGIEFTNKFPFTKKFSKKQMQSGLQLCKFLMKKYQIAPQNIVGHTDIAYFKEDGFLNRKQDPSHLFDWKFLGQNGVGIFHDIDDKEINDKILFAYEDKSEKIVEIKKNLMRFGYKISNFNDVFDKEMVLLARVFNRHFNAKVFENDFDENDFQPEINTPANKWYLSSDLKLQNILKILENVTA